MYSSSVKGKLERSLSTSSRIASSEGTASINVIATDDSMISMLFMRSSFSAQHRWGPFGRRHARMVQSNIAPSGAIRRPDEKSGVHPLAGLKSQQTSRHLHHPVSCCPLCCPTPCLRTVSRRESMSESDSGDRPAVVCGPQLVNPSVRKLRDVKS